MLIGILNPDFSINSDDINTSFKIPEDAIIMLETKKASENYCKALIQQSTNLSAFSEWIETKYKWNLFGDNNKGIGLVLDNQLETHINSKKRFPLYLIVATNGDSHQIPDKKTMREQLTIADERKMFLLKCFENQNMKINPRKDMRSKSKCCFCTFPTVSLMNF